MLIAYKAATVAAEPALAVLTGRDDKVADELAAAAATRPDADGHKKIGETVTSLWARDTSWLAAASGTEDMGCVIVLWRHTR